MTHGAAFDAMPMPAAPLRGRQRSASLVARGGKKIVRLHIFILRRCVRKWLCTQAAWRCLARPRRSATRAHAARGAGAGSRCHVRPSVDRASQLVGRLTRHRWGVPACRACDTSPCLPARQPGRLTGLRCRACARRREATRPPPARSSLGSAARRGGCAGQGSARAAVGAQRSLLRRAPQPHRAGAQCRTRGATQACAAARRRRRALCWCVAARSLTRQRAPAATLAARAPR
jgi:hypothetical protein